MKKKEKNPFVNSDTNKRYYTFDCYLKRRFGRKCAKISLDGGFSCPNIDGKVGYGGCIYCSERGSGDFAPSPVLPLKTQFEEGVRLVNGKWRDAYYIPYFQAHSNTYAPLSVLKEKFEEALSFDRVVGLSVATRCDCLDDEKIEYLRELSERTYFTLELGLQSANERTLRLINRGHTLADFERTLEKLDGINVCIHIINGLPGEGRKEMMETAHKLASYRPHEIKIHMLYVLKNTPIHKMYERGEFSLLSLGEYTSLVVDQLEVIPGGTVIGRVTGDGVKDDLVAPLWTLKKTVVANEIDKEFARRGTYQGYFCEKR